MVLELPNFSEWREGQSNTFKWESLHGKFGWFSCVNMAKAIEFVCHCIPYNKLSAICISFFIILHFGLSVCLAEAPQPKAA